MVPSWCLYEIEEALARAVGTFARGMGRLVADVGALRDVRSAVDAGSDSDAEDDGALSDDCGGDRAAVPIAVGARVRVREAEAPAAQVGTVTDAAECAGLMLYDVRLDGTTFDECALPAHTLTPIFDDGGRGGARVRPARGATGAPPARARLLLTVANCARLRARVVPALWRELGARFGDDTELDLTSASARAALESVQDLEESALERYLALQARAMRRAAAWPAGRADWVAEAAGAVVLRLACVRCEARELLGALPAPGEDGGALYAEHVLSLCVEGLSEHGPVETDAWRKLDALLLPALAGRDDGEAGLRDAARMLMMCAFGGALRS